MTWVETGSRPGPGLGDMFLDARIDIGEGADGAGNGAGGDFLARGDRRCAAALELGIGQAPSLMPKVVGSAWMPCERPIVTVSLCSKARRLSASSSLSRSASRRSLARGELHVEAGVEHVGRGHALMDEAASGPTNLGEMCQERDDVMLGDGFDLVDARDVEGGGAALFPDGLCRFLRDDAEFGQRVAGMRLDLEPDAEFGFRRPDGHHFRPGVTGDHGLSAFVIGGVG